MFRDTEHSSILNNLMNRAVGVVKCTLIIHEKKPYIRHTQNEHAFDRYCLVNI